MPAASQSRSFAFGIFQVDIAARELRRSGIVVRLQEQPFQILEMLLENAGNVVTREAIRQRLWPADTFIDFDNSVNASVNRLREALGDSATNPRFIETIPKRGYRFIAPLTGFPVATTNPIAEPAPQTDATNSNKKRKMVIAVALSVIVVAAAAVLYFSRWRKQDTATAGPIRSIAVLPLRNLSGDPGQDYFADGMTDELITEIAKLSDLKVISFTSVTRFRNSTTSIPEIARQLGVDGVLEGSVVRDGNRARITIQLIRASTDHHVWAEGYERDLKDILSLQREIAVDVGHQISRQTTLRTGLNSSDPVRKIDPAAHEAYLKGLFYWNRSTPESIQKALEQFKESAKISPDYPQSYIGIANCYAALGGWYAVQPRDEALPRARAAVNEALKYDDSLAEAHDILGKIYEEYDWNWSAAEREYRRAIQVNPSYAAAHLHLAKNLLEQGRLDEVAAEVERARAADPLSLVDVATGAWILEYAGEHEAALKRVQDVIDMDPNLAYAQFIRGLIHMDRGELDQAAGQFHTAIRMEPSFGKYQAHLAFTLARSGNTKEARRLLEKLRRTNNIVSFDVALVLSGIGDTELAIDFIEKAVQERSIELVYVRVLATPNLYERPFYMLRQERRFKTLLSKVNLPQLVE